MLALPAVRKLGHDPRLHRVRFDWRAAGEQGQRTVTQLSQQLRRFLDDRTRLVNRCIGQLIQPSNATPSPCGNRHPLVI